MDLPNKSPQGPIEPPKKDLKPVIQGAQLAKRPSTRRFFDFMFQESPKMLVGRISRDVLVPRAKAGVEEALNSFISGMFWGTGGRPMSGIVQQAMMRGGGINYQQISSQNPALSAARQANTTRSSGNYRDIVCPTQEAAEFLLANMYDLLNQYRVVAVADLYEIAGMTPAPSDNAYGWTSLDGARINKVRDGYSLELPRPNLI